MTVDVTCYKLMHDIRQITSGTLVFSNSYLPFTISK
jgi:hypothetical protein